MLRLRLVRLIVLALVAYLAWTFLGGLLFALERAALAPFAWMLPL